MATASARAKLASSRKEPSQELTKLQRALAKLSSETDPQPFSSDPSGEPLVDGCSSSSCSSSSSPSSEAGGP